MHKNTERFHRILDEMKAMHDKKSKDYGTDADPLANVKASEGFGIPAWVGCMIRANDKMQRIQSFAKKGELANESLEDSLMDLAVYSVIALVLREEEMEDREAALDDISRLGQKMQRYFTPDQVEFVRRQEEKAQTTGTMEDLM